MLKEFWRCAAVLLLVLCSFYIKASAYESDGFNNRLSNVDKLDFSGLDSALTAIGAEDFSDSQSIVTRLSNGGIGGVLSEASGYAANTLRRESGSALGFIIPVLGACVVCAVVSLVSQGAAKNIEALKFLCAAAIFSLGCVDFIGIVSIAKEAAENASQAGSALLSVLAAALVISGNPSSGVLLGGAAAVLGNIVIDLICVVAIPLAVSSLIIGTVGSLMKLPLLVKASSAAGKIATRGIGVITALYIGFLTVSKAIAVSTDSMLIGAAKFSAGTFIPVVGRTVSEAMSAAFAGASIIKNSVGAFGVIIMLIVVAAPVLRIVLRLIFINLLGAFSELAADEQTADIIDRLAQCLNQLLAAVVAASLIFIITAAASLVSVPI